MPFSILILAKRRGNVKIFFKDSAGPDFWMRYGGAGAAWGTVIVQVHAFGWRKLPAFTDQCG